MSSPVLERDEPATVAAFCDEHLRLQNARLPHEYFYQHVSLCVIDAVFSIGVRYEGVQNVVERYCHYYHLQKLRNPRHRVPPQMEQESLPTFIAKVEELGAERFAEQIFCNHQLTSSRGGILKADAVLRFARVLRDANIEYQQDVPIEAKNHKLEMKLREIPGQGSGISVKYFFMLAGFDDLVKPDRWIISFLERCLRSSCTLDRAQLLLSDACRTLRSRYPHLTPRLLDNQIWSYERSRAK